MATKEKLVEKEPRSLLSLLVSLYNPDGIMKKLALSIASTILLIIFAISTVVVGLTAWSLCTKENKFLEILTIINTHSRAEVDRIVCMIIPIITNSLLYSIFLIGQQLHPASTTEEVNTKRPGRKLAMFFFTLWFIMITGCDSWSSWRKYLALVSERLAKENQLAGTEEAFISNFNELAGANDASQLYSSKHILAGTMNYLSTAQEKLLGFLQTESGVSNDGTTQDRNWDGMEVNMNLMD